MDAPELADVALATAGADTLDALEAVTRLRREGERLEAVLVRRARNEGATWAQIATALGTSRQAVHKKHGGRGLFGGQA